MERIAKFEKVSFGQYKKDYHEKVDSTISDDELWSIYNGIKLPERSTEQSAGYDFFAPTDIEIKEGRWIDIPTGISCAIAEGWSLMLFVRSGLGFRHKTRLANGTGIVDADYIYADNEGHIGCRMTAESLCKIEKGKAYMQGLFLPFGITIDDNATGKRTGGFGSTDKAKE